MTPKDLPELTDVQASQNTDREVWRETPGDFYSNSVHLTATGGLGINVGGTVYVKPPAEWHRLASGARSTAAQPVGPTGLRSAALAMVAKMDVLKPHMDALCLDSHNRGRPYKGPTYGIELEALRAAASGDSTPPSDPADGEQLWLWRNGDHFLAFRHLYPCYSPGGDPMTLGEPFGRAIFKHSHNREGKPNEQQPTDRQSPRSGADLDLQRRHTTAAQPVEPTYEPIVEVWHGGRKVTVYPPRTVLRVWGTNMATEMSNEPFNLKTVQQAMDWLYSAPPAASGDSTPPSASVQGDSTERSGCRPEAVDRERGAR